MAHKLPCQKYTFVKNSDGQPGKFISVDEPPCKDEESPADYNTGGYLPVKVNDVFHSRYRVVRKLGLVLVLFYFSIVLTLSQYWIILDGVTFQLSGLLGTICAFNLSKFQLSNSLII